MERFCRVREPRKSIQVGESGSCRSGWESEEHGSILRAQLSVAFWNHSIQFGAEARARRHGRFLAVLVSRFPLSLSSGTGEQYRGFSMKDCLTKLGSACLRNDAESDILVEFLPVRLRTVFHVHHYDRDIVPPTFRGSAPGPGKDVL